MKILLIANANNIWVHAFINHVISGQDELYLLNENEIKDEYDKTYQERKVTLLGTIKPIHRIPKIGPELRKKNYCRAIRKIGHFDRCIILNTTTYRLSVWDEIKDLVDRTVVLYWGSDIHRVSQQELLNQKKYLDNVDNIVFTAQNLQRAFMKLYPQSYTHKLSVIHFGLESLVYIDEISRKYTREQIKIELGVPLNKKTVAIGYCGIPEQQHERIIKELSGLNEQLKSQICIILQFMYNTTPSYREHIISILQREKIDYIVFDKFLSPHELAKLRLATDYFINAQTTDAIAGGVLESLYAGASLINGKWLDYPEFAEWGIRCFVFDNFSSLTNSLIEAIDAEITDTSAGLQRLFKDMNWELCRLEWQPFLE